MAAVRERLHELPEPVGKLGRARRPTRMGRNGLVRLCTQAPPGLFRQRRPPMGHEWRKARRATPRLGSNRRPCPGKTAHLLSPQCRPSQNRFALGQADELAAVRKHAGTGVSQSWSLPEPISVTRRERAQPNLSATGCLRSENRWRKWAKLLAQRNLPLSEGIFAKRHRNLDFRLGSCGA
jgi:hypothetical protein